MVLDLSQPADKIDSVVFIRPSIALLRLVFHFTLLFPGARHHTMPHMLLAQNQLRVIKKVTSWEIYDTSSILLATSREIMAFQFF